MINKIKEYIINNKKHAIIYASSFLVGFALVSFGSSPESRLENVLNEKETQTFVYSDNKKALEEKQIEIDELKKEIEGIKSSIKNIEDTDKVSSNANSGVSSSNDSQNVVYNNVLAQNVKGSKIHVINTGNSDSILITGGKNVLIDGGDNDDEQAVVNYLKNNGVNKIDYLISTHPHADHVGGLDAVVSSISVGQAFIANGSADTKTYTDFVKAMANKGLKPSVPLEGAKFILGNGEYIQIFNGNGGKHANEQSLVTLYVNGNDKSLFMGDAEEGTEGELLSKLPKVDMLKVGHHGSKSSSSSSFINKVSPQIAVVTAGKDNKYGHPHKETMDKLKNNGIVVHRTDECGSIVFNSTGSGIKTGCKTGSYNSGK